MTKATAVNPKTERSIRKFNPGTLQSDEDVIDQFVVRDGELTIVLDVLRGNIDSPSCQHVLIVAPRGRGKTMLLARVGAALRTVDALSRFLLPVRFTEESHEIFNLADFWLDALFHLARECAAQDPSLARDLRTTHDALSSRWQDQMLDQHARAAVLGAADRLGKKLVLMVENMQDLRRNVDDDFGWKLRDVLQSEPQIMLLSSATSRFKGLDDASQPFFELFRLVHLEPLATGECRQLWHAVSGEPVTGREVRPLEILTGGSPRLLVIVAGFARHRSIRQLMEELVTLVDEHTEYFRNHLEVLSKVERRVYLAVIDLWQPSTPGEIAARARTDIRVVSTMLGRLLNRGAVIADGSGKRRFYSAAERLYSIYYKLRRERDEAAVVRNLIHFMVVFYTEDELSELSERLFLEVMESPVIREGLDRALAELPLADDCSSGAVKVLSHVSSRATETYHRELLRRIASAFKNNAFDTIIEVANQALASHRGGSHRLTAVLTAHILRRKADAYCRLGEWHAAIATCDELLVQFGDCSEPDVRWHIAAALNTRGGACVELSNHKEAIAVHTEVVTRLERSDDADSQWLAATALAGQGDTYVKLGDRKAAIAVYDEVIARFGKSHDSHVRWRVAASLADKGDVYAGLGDTQAALSAYDEVISRFGSIDTSSLDWPLLYASVRKADVYGILGNWTTAIALYGEAITRFGDSDDVHLQTWIASALIGRGDARSQRGEWDVAIGDYDEVISRYTASDSPRLQWRLAEAFLQKANAYAELGDARAAVAIYDEAVAHLADSDDENVRWQVATALLAKGKKSGMLGDFGTAAAAYEEVVTRFAKSDEPDIQLRVAVALVNGARVRVQSGELKAAIAVYDQLVSLYGDTDEPRIQSWVALALADRGTTQADFGLADEALRSSEELEQRLQRVLNHDEEVR